MESVGLYRTPDTPVPERAAEQLTDGHLQNRPLLFPSARMTGSNVMICMYVRSHLGSLLSE